LPDRDVDFEISQHTSSGVAPHSITRTRPGSKPSHGTITEFLESRDSATFAKASVARLPMF
jgi:hypothetical protein